MTTNRYEKMIECTGTQALEIEKRRLEDLNNTIQLNIKKGLLYTLHFPNSPYDDKEENAHHFMEQNNKEIKKINEAIRKFKEKK